jgi:hypothetical protein
MSNVSAKMGMRVYPYQRLFLERKTAHRVYLTIPKWVTDLLPHRTENSTIPSFVSYGPTLTLLAIHAAHFPLPPGFKFGLPPNNYDTQQQRIKQFALFFKRSELNILTVNFAQRTCLSHTSSILKTAIYLSLGLLPEINNSPPGAPTPDHIPEPLTPEDLIDLYKLYNPDCKVNHPYVFIDARPTNLTMATKTAKV